MKIMKKIIASFLLFFISQINLFGQDFQWVRQIKGVNSDYNEFVNGLAIDSDQNSYVVGNTESYVFDLDPTVSGTELIDNSLINHTFKGTFLIKTDVDGNYLWGLTFGNYKGSSDEALDVKIGTDGNVYVLLSLSELNVSMNYIENFTRILKIAPNGNIINTINIQQYYGANNSLSPSSFDLDSQNNIFLSGWFHGNLTINNIPNLNLNTTDIDVFLLKISNTGNYDWAKQVNVYNDSSNQVLVRPDGNINLLVKNNADSILFNIDSTTNNIIWQKEFLNQRETIFHVSNNSIAILGDKDYSITIDVDPSSNTNNVSGNCRFIIFLNLDGTFLDVKTFNKPPSSDLGITAITTDTAGNYFIAGFFGENVDFDPSSNTYNLTAGNSYGGVQDLFYLKLDANRNFESVINFGQEVPFLSYYNICQSIQVKKIKIVNNNNYMIGEFSRICDFNPSNANQASLSTINLTTLNLDGFILKLGPCNTAMPNGSTTQSFCSSQNAKISDLSPNSSSIKWYDTATSTTQLSSTLPLVNGQIYYASKQIGSCNESARLAVTVTINPSPLAPLVTNQTFCESDNATIANLNALGQNIKWYSSATSTNNLAPTTLLQNNIDYYASQTVNGCESSRAILNVTITTVATPILSSPQFFCLQQNATLSSIAISGSNIKWYDALTGGNLLPNSTILINGTTYYATQTSNNCESLRVPVLITIQNTPAPTGMMNQTFCSTQNPTLSDIVINGSSLLWYNSISSTTTLSSSTALVNGSTYYVSQSLNNCESTYRFEVTVTLIISLNANDYSELFCDYLNDGFETINLQNFNSNLINTPTNHTFEYYLSFTGALNQNNIELINSVTNYQILTGINTIYVRITSNNGCYQIVKLTLTVVNKPRLTIPDRIPICQTSYITVDAGSGFDSYLWSTGASTQTIIIASAGTYSVTVTKNYGTINCATTKTFEVVLSNAAIITSISTQDWTNNDNIITVNTSGIGDYVYSIDNVTYQTSNIFTGLNSGFYTVYVKDSNGCGITEDDVVLLMYPKFFTPNGDGFNDFWSINFSYLENDFKVKIVDRYGKFITELKNKDTWNGKYNDNNAPSDDYWFLVTRNNGKEYRGHFTLKR